jgi:hypothetical protein
MAVVAQWLERLTVAQEAGGSNLLIRPSLLNLKSPLGIIEGAFILVKYTSAYTNAGENLGYVKLLYQPKFSNRAGYWSPHVEYWYK